MKKSKLIKGIFVLAVLIVAVALIYGLTNYFSGSDIKSTSVNNSLKAEEVDKDNSTSISEGILIKKYPDNYACFKFELPNGTKIITDPYEMDETVKPDVVTESHQHGDHTDVAKLKGDYKLIKTDGKFEIKNLKITGFSGKHGKGGPEGSNIIYVFDINGIKIAHFASQGELPNDQTLKDIGKVDLLLIQTFNPAYHSKLTIEECKVIIDKLTPKIVIPEHGREKVGEALAKQIGTEVEYIDTGKMAVTRKMLDEIEKVKVMDLDTIGLTGDFD